MKFAVFGSCMSNLPAAALTSTYGWTQTHSIHHNRSDYFIKCFIEESTPPKAYADLSRTFQLREDAPRDAAFILQNQSRDLIGLHELQSNKETYGNFIEYINRDPWDVILLDNFMDVAAKLVYDRFEDPDQTRLLFLNASFYKDSEQIADRYYHTEFLSPEESARNWLAIYKWIRERQPNAKIFFLSYHYCSSTEHQERYQRIFGFYPEFTKICRGEDINIFSPLNVRDDLTNGQEDWPHFQMPLYHALAGHIYLSVEGKFNDTNMSSHDPNR